METDVARNLREVRSALPEGVRLVAISKFHPSECILSLIHISEPTRPY